MDIEELNRIKNRSVQQQNLLEFLKMKKVSEDFRKQPKAYPWLLETLSKNDIDVNTGIVVSLTSVPEQLGNQWFATWLTYDKRFFEIEILANYHTHELIEIDELGENFPLVSAQCKGTGKSSAFLALELLESYV